MKTILTYGTFDLFHVGHLKLFERCRSMGDQLIVGVSTDEFNALKGKRTIIKYSDRAELVASCKYVDQVFPEENWDQKKTDIIKYSADVFVMGDDWTGKFDFLSEFCKVIYLPRTPNVSTTDIKGAMSVFNAEKNII